jgi:hypothetical protein
MRGAWPGRRRWDYDVHARPRRTVLRWNVLRWMAREDGAREDGATEDGATEDGATEDGAKEDGAKEDGAAVVAVSGTHGLGGPCYRSRLRRMATEDGGRHARPRRTVLQKSATEDGATEDGVTVS